MSGIGLAFRKGGDYPFALSIGHAGPPADLVKGAIAADAYAALRVHLADLDAGRLHASLNALFTLDDGSRPSTPQIQRPISTRRRRSTPVFTPSPFSM